ncbi:MAG: DUF899 family protein [Bdellovibrionaceae bacterium]|nr:DUF899 family protein [Pseudobdellovibrionaceae bacterium]
MTELQKLEKELYDHTLKVASLRRDAELVPVKNYKFSTLDGEVTLLQLFEGKEILFLIHNMGQGCSFCTLWADGLNGFVAHLESHFSLAMVSKDSPQIQRKFANSRNWRFKMASHGGGEYISEQSVLTGETNYPGILCYVRKGNEIFRKNSAVFGPGDEFCPQWNILSLAGLGEEQWQPQYSYWKCPEQLDDGK